MHRLFLSFYTDDSAHNPLAPEVPLPQFPARFTLTSALLAFLLLLSACGGSKTNPNTITSFLLGTSQTGAFQQLTTTQSLQQTQVVQLTTQSKNTKGVVLSPAVTWSSSNPSIVSVSTTGEVCGGTWDANFINCTPGPVGSATITASAQGQTATLTFNVHARISSVTLGPAQSGCSSQTQTVQYNFHAFDAAGTDITSQVGTPTFTVADGTIANVDTQGLATARNPGATTITAFVGGITSAPTTFVTCPPAKIVLHKSGDPAGTTTTSFTLATSASQQLVADVTDTKGNPLVGLNLTLFSNQPAAVSASGLIITGSDVGFGSVVAACTPPSCNPGNNLNVPGTGVPSYSNLVTATITGTAANTTVYVTGINDSTGAAKNTSLIPITTSNNTAGTALTLPGVPNSMVVSPKGDTLFIGTSAGLTLVSTAANTVGSAITNAPGRVLAVNLAGTQAVLFDAASGHILLFDSAGSTSTSAGTITLVQSATNATAAAFSPDGFKIFVAADNQIYEYNSTTLARRTVFPSNPTSVVALPQGVAAYATPYNSGNNQIASIATCNNALLTTPNVPLPSLLSVSPDGTQLVGVSASTWMTLPYTVNAGGCPPSLNEGGASSFGYAGGTPTQLVVSPTGNYAFATSSTSSAGAVIPFLNLTSNTSGSAALANSASGTFTTGQFTLDGTSFWVGVTGGSAGNSVHRFDTSGATPTDATQVTVSFSPDFVVVKP